MAIARLQEFRAAGLPEDFAIILNHISDHVFDLRIKWRVYAGLWGTHKERFELLNDVSPITSRVLEVALFHEIILTLRRLTDPEKRRGGRESVSIKAFLKFMGESEVVEFRTLMNDACNSAEFARQYSGLRVAHLDLDYLRGRVPQESLNRKNIERAIEKVTLVVKCIYARRLGASLVTHPIIGSDDETSFVRTIFEGVTALGVKESESRELVRLGRYQEARRLFEYPTWLEPTETPDEALF